MRNGLGYSLQGLDAKCEMSSRISHLSLHELVILKNRGKFCPCEAVRTCFELVILKNGDKFRPCEAVRTCFELVILKNGDKFCPCKACSGGAAQLNIKKSRKN